jgi:hypothetical protein
MPQCSDKRASREAAQNGARCGHLYIDTPWFIKEHTVKNLLTAMGVSVLALIFAGGAQAGLVNGTFEADDASFGDQYGATGWFAFENAFTNNTAGPTFGPVSHDQPGTQSLKTFANSGSPSGVYQDDNSVSAGQRYMLETWAMNWIGDQFLESIGILQLQFRDGGGNVLGAPTDAFIFPFEPLPAKPLHYDLSDVKSGASVSDWTRISLEAVAPAGTSSARVYLLHINDSFGASGSIRWDDVSLTAVPDSQVPVPATLALFGLGLAGLGLARLRLSRRART